MNGSTNGTTQVTTGVGVYVVTEISPTTGLRVHVVGKDRTCSCGKRRCPHVRAVAAYLKAGGKRAPETPQERPTSPSSPSVPTTCPICGGEVEVQDVSGTYPLWRCQNDSSHYWQWRGERNGVREFLTRSHANKTGAFYEQSTEERKVFLDLAQGRLVAYYATA